MSAGCRSSITGARGWSSSKDKVWIGLEYFCNDTDPLWKLSDEEMAKFAIAEIAKIGILKAEDVEDFARGPRSQDLSGLLRQL